MRNRTKFHFRRFATSALECVNGGYEEGYEGGDFDAASYDVPSYEAPAYDPPADTGGDGNNGGGGGGTTGGGGGGYQNEMESANSTWNAGTLAQGGTEASWTGNANPVDADQVLRNLPLPDQVTPTFTEADLRPDATQTQAQDGFNDSRFQLKSPDIIAANAALERQVDIAQNYRDLASPPELYQMNLNERDTMSNCSVVSTLNEVASTEQGRAHLASRIESLGDGLHRVTLDNADGSPNPIVVQEPAANVGTPGDANLRIFERALSVSRAGQFEDEAGLYAGVDRGANPTQTFQQLGLTGPNGTGSPETIWRSDPSMTNTALNTEASTLNTQVFRGTDDRPYGLYGNHAYQVTSSYANPETGERMVVLNNPWGNRHPQPIPESQIPSYFDTSSVGRIPRR